MKAAIFVGTFFLSVTLMSQTANSEKSYTKEIESTASVEDTWQLLSDVSMWKQWDSHIIDARLNGEFIDKAQGSLVTINAKVVNFYIVDWEEKKSYILRHKLSSGTFFSKRSVEATETGSKIVVEVWCNGLSKKNFKKYMGDDYASVLQEELLKIRQLLES